MSLGNHRKSGVNWLDITLIVILLMLWFLIVQVWDNRLPVVMLSVTLFATLLYSISKFTGFLGYIKLTVPTWTLSGIISFVIWSIMLRVIPVNVGASSIAENITDGVLSNYLSHNTIVRLMQIFMFPITESLLIIFLFAFFVGVAVKKTGLGQNYKPTLLPLGIVSSFSALIHLSVADSLNEIGLVNLDISLWQQFLSFFIFIATGIFLFAPGIIASHIIKGLLIFGNTGWWIFTFTLFAFLDIMSITLAKKEKTGLSEPAKYFT